MWGFTKVGNLDNPQNSIGSPCRKDPNKVPNIVDPPPILKEAGPDRYMYMYFYVFLVMEKFFSTSGSI